MKRTGLGNMKKTIHLHQGTPFCAWGGISWVVLGGLKESSVGEKIASMSSRESNILTVIGARVPRRGSR